MSRRIVVYDRAHNTLQIFARRHLPGDDSGFGLPANIDTWKNLMVVPELKACVTLLDEDNKPVDASSAGRSSGLDEVKNLRGVSPTSGLTVSLCIPTTPASHRRATSSWRSGWPPADRPSSSGCRGV